MTRATDPLRDLGDLRVSAMRPGSRSVDRRGAEHAEDAQRRHLREPAFRRPAEWEPHEATWIGWPHNRSDWPGKFAMIPWVYAEIVKKLTADEIVRVIADSQAHEARGRRVLSRAGADLTRVEFFRFPTNRGWTRDFGPMFVKRAGKQSEVAIVRFRFNGWAKYRDWQKDDQVPERAAHALGCRLLTARINKRDVVLEGGAIDVNGRGTLVA